jgi:GNAT superfamily N-acetyltransferase
MISEPCPLQDRHDVNSFDCGIDELNSYLQRYARQTQKREGTRTYVVLDGNQVIAYYTIVFGGIAWIDAPDYVRKGLGKYQIPIMIIARLAVDSTWAGKGLGNSLLLDALKRVVAASEIAGLRAVVVDAKNNTAKQFYEKRGFRSWPIDSKRLFITMTELKREM